ncbi:hypothetical protein [Legionella jamestowniensis]|uniref:Uncharacterized protein n=1 Tax=Legionella jamestowniensis TaxID=455 RepID=A0A0W0UWC5_9GAMM|nr:hypothetical protein [Legionella jamestowniensis]KTD12178.1 hypothetical protein Ljam_0394 [Legionella jamestowniensis]OCH98651.1 hypothetical protein A8135_11245 [Legionella jamestowniensis]SFL75603.1 hypothetical protein SAMN02746073_1712 [Legionella jamestowniensis DSM 19215]
MKRLALLAVTAFLAVILSACGDNAEKKAENNATTTMEQQDHNKATDTTDANKTEQTPAQ